MADIELINQKLVSLDTGLKTHYHSPLDGLVTTISNDETPGITYALKIGGTTTRIPWCVARASSVGEGVLFDYAGPTNNPTMINASMAWNTRATLQYGTAQQA